MTASLTYAPATELPSVGIFDYWDPATAVQRLLCGGAVDQMEIDLNGDFHEFRFSGAAQDVVDSASLGSSPGGAAELQSFPAEPVLGAFDYTIVPGESGASVAGDVGKPVLHDHVGIGAAEERVGAANEGIRIELAEGDRAR
ncbi:MAG: hypothetical protein WDO73_10365 [Ignavibacteriota bacterium]